MTNITRALGRAFFLPLLVFALAVPATAQTPGEEAAREAAESWLELLDAEDFAKTWEEAASFFQESIGEDEWVQQVTTIRQQTGEVEDRDYVASESETDPDGVPEGEYVNIQYQSEFGTAGAAAEVVVLVHEEERGWRVVGYFLQPVGV